MKTYVITISKVFPSYHPKKGIATEFRYGIEIKRKKHTIRGNYAFWKKRIDEVNNGNAILCIREWTGKPYYSPQTTLFTFSKGEVGIQPLNITVGWFGKTKGILAYIPLEDFETRLIDVKQLVANDGLDLQDFYDWFNKPLENPCIIHFSDLRY